MRWEIKFEKQDAIVVKLPNDLGYDTWVPVEIGDSCFELQWHSMFQNFFLRDDKGLEHSIKVRSSELKRFPGDSEYTCHLELAMPGALLINRLEATVEPYVPGGAFRKKEGEQGGAIMRSPMVGKILQVLVADGNYVTKNQELCIIEAMKMENKILAPVNGVVAATKIKLGDHVGIGDQLMKIEAPPAKES